MLNWFWFHRVIEEKFRLLLHDVDIRPYRQNLQISQQLRKKSGAFLFQTLYVQSLLTRPGKWDLSLKKIYL